MKSNMILHAPFMGAGLYFEEGKMKAVKYQAAHHELVASAIAISWHEIDPENKVGCMLAAGQYYPNTANPADYWAALQEDRESYFFIDVSPRRISNYAEKKWERLGIWGWKWREDLDLLKTYTTVDFISFSYYSSRVASGDPRSMKKLPEISFPA